MSQYRIRTVMGAGVAVAIGGGVSLFEIQEPSSGKSAHYYFYSFDSGAGGKLGVSGPSEWSDFSANCGLQEFTGYVILKQAGGALVVGVSANVMNFITGKAAGLEITGNGWQTGLNVGVLASHGYFHYCPNPWSLTAW